MARNYRELRGKMSPEGRARSEAKTQRMIDEMPLGGELEIRAVFPEGEVRITRLTDQPACGSNPRPPAPPKTC